MGVQRWIVKDWICYFNALRKRISIQYQGYPPARCASNIGMQVSRASILGCFCQHSYSWIVTDISEFCVQFFSKHLVCGGRPISRAGENWSNCLEARLLSFSLCTSVASWDHPRVYTGIFGWDIEVALEHAARCGELHVSGSGIALPYSRAIHKLEPGHNHECPQRGTSCTRVSDTLLDLDLREIASVLAFWTFKRWWFAHQPHETEMPLLVWSLRTWPWVEDICKWLYPL